MSRQKYPLLFTSRIVSEIRLEFRLEVDVIPNIEVAFSDSLTTPFLWQAFSCSLGAQGFQYGMDVDQEYCVLCQVRYNNLSQTNRKHLCPINEHVFVWCVVLKQHSAHMQRENLMSVRF